MHTEVLALILLLCSGTWAQNSSAQKECSVSEESRPDVVLVLDGFNHISPGDFSRVRDFLQTLVPKLGPVGPDLVRISLVKCGQDPEAEFYLDTFHNLSSVLANVSRMSQSPPLPGGSTGDAVDFIWENIFRTDRGHRKNTPDILILVTDRNSSGVNTDLLNDLWRKDVKVFVVGVKVTVGLQANEEDLDDAEVFTVEDYNGFSNIFKELTQSLCHWLQDRLGRAPPESLRFTEVQPRRARASWEFNRRQVQYFDLWVFLDRSDSSVQTISVLGHKRSTEISHLLPNTTYTITVSAWHGTGLSNRETAVLTTPPDRVRLSGGPGRCSGSVDLLMDRSWSSVCGRDFGLTEAAVVCGELDCGSVSGLHQGAPFTEGPAVSRSFHCDGVETSLRDCESSETNCSTAAHISCSDEVLRLDYFSCYGDPYLRHKDEWRPVMAVPNEDLDMDFGSVLCEQMGCGSALEVDYYKVLSGPFWWLEPECVKQRSGLTDCVDLDSTVNMTKGRLYLRCSGLHPVVRAKVLSNGGSVSSERGSHVERVLLRQGTNLVVSCSLEEPFVPGQFHLLSPTGNYTHSAHNHSVYFLLQYFGPAHIGNYTCVYCVNNDIINDCFKSTPLYITPGDSHLHIRAAIFVLVLLLWAIAVFFTYKRCRRQNKAIRAGHKTPSAEYNAVEMVAL